MILNGITLDVTNDKEFAECSAFKNGGVIVDIYPDFEQPENFVKLMELKIDRLIGCSQTVMGILNDECYHSNRRDYIEFLCKFSILTSSYRDELKQVIKETEWIYE